MTTNRSCGLYVRAEPSWLWQEQGGLVRSLLLSHGQGSLRLKQFAQACISLQWWYLNDLNCSFSQAPKLLVQRGVLRSRKLVTPHFGPVFLLGVMTARLGIIAVESDLALPSVEKSGRAAGASDNP